MSNRNETPKELQLVTPSWLEEAIPEDDTSLDSVMAYKRVPIIKVLQSLSDTELLDKHGVGSAILQPLGSLLCNAGKKFKFVPIFMFTEWQKRSDRRDKVSPMVMEKSFDKMGELAKMAANKDTREEPYKDNPEWRFRYVECLNFCGVIYDGPLKGNEAVMQFVKGEYFTGTNFCSVLSMRKIGGKFAPLYSQVFEFTPKLRERDSNKWYGLDFEASDPSIVTQDEFQVFKDQHEETKKLFLEKKLQVDGEDHDEAVEEEVTSEM